jgi:hypothetical protein
MCFPFCHEGALGFQIDRVCIIVIWLEDARDNKLHGSNCWYETVARSLANILWWWGIVGLQV